jgi:hypothetical protein
VVHTRRSSAPEGRPNALNRVRCRERLVFLQTAVRLVPLCHLGRLAQLVEQLAYNEQVVGSIPAAPTNKSSSEATTTPTCLAARTFARRYPAAIPRVERQDVGGRNVRAERGRDHLAPLGGRVLVDERRSALS